MMIAGDLNTTKHNNLSHSHYPQTWQQLLDHLYKTGANIGSGPDEYDWDTVPQYISFGSDSPPNAYLFSLYLTDRDNEPFLYWNRGLAIRKDIVSGGRLDTMEGVVSMFGGVGWGPDRGPNHTASMPFIWLIGNHYGHPEKDTLEIRISDPNDSNFDTTWSWGKLECARFTVHRDGKGYPNPYPDTQSVHLRHDGSHGYITADTGDLVLAANSGIVRTGTINPASGQGTGKVGDHNGPYWGEISGYDIWVHTSRPLDAYDDLALVKQWGERYPKLENYDKSKVVPPEDDIFSILRLDSEGNVSPNKEMLNFGQLANFALGCAKALAIKQDEQNEIIGTLLERIEALEAQLQRDKAAA